MVGLLYLKPFKTRELFIENRQKFNFHNKKYIFPTLLQCYIHIAKQVVLTKFEPFQQVDVSAKRTF